LGGVLWKKSRLLCRRKIIINIHKPSLTLLTEKIFAYEGLCSVKLGGH